MTPIKTIVVDASVMLKAYLRDESDVSRVDALLQDLSDGRLKIAAPSLMRYEISNALWAAARQGRITASDALTAQAAFFQIDIEYYEREDLLTDALVLPNSTDALFTTARMWRWRSDGACGSSQATDACTTPCRPS